jgi:EAL domain-containing protein (putative c-di-GMP-specific phosphodiesterase class I)
VVLEVTEHAAVADYPAFRAAMAELGPKVRLAVDDAGAGFASLRHILELRPAFVKLDRWLVADLESDDARQAMIVGLRHFARSTGCRLIAEGIETDRELAVLRTLDIPLGQGFLLGRPLPIAAVLVAVTAETGGG